MATTYDEIYDSFLVSVRDYNLDALHTSSESDFYNYLLGFFKKAIAKFTNCDQDLTARNDTTRIFTITLTPLEVEILASLMLLEWLSKEINDITQITLHLQGGDIKTYAEANNLKEKKAHRQELREEIDNLMTRYGLVNVPWTDWANQDFSGS